MNRIEKPKEWLIPIRNSSEETLCRGHGRIAGDARKRNPILQFSLKFAGKLSEALVRNQRESVYLRIVTTEGRDACRYDSCAGCTIPPQSVPFRPKAHCAPYELVELRRA